MIIHLYGFSPDMDQIVGLCNRYQVPLIEDAAESLGSLYKGQHTGTFGAYGIFSFNGNKIITTSGGGMLVSDNEERIAKVKFWATQSKEPARWYQHHELGFNYTMSNIVAGIVRGQLRVLDQRLARKKEIYEFYKRELECLEDVSMMPLNDWDEPNYWLSCINLSGRVLPMDVIEALEAENIESRPVWKPMHLQPFFENCDFISSAGVSDSDNSVSARLFNNGVCLPSDTKMTDSDLERIVGIIKGLW
jgi:dTDP-4-amino-4,6-dideoxygalactose transaminase